MNADLDALATRLYDTIDDLLDDHPLWQPERPAVGITPNSPMPNRSPSPSSKPYSATPRNVASSATPTPISDPGSRSCPNAPRTTNDSAPLAS